MPHPPSPGALNTPLSRGWKGGKSISAREREGYGCARNLKADLTVT